MSPTGTVKVAILGGGAAALTTALELSHPRHAGKYELTVYQMGWRLGGKGASGRNRDHGQRIEEHGIHVWFGFYENAFRLLSGCFDELKAPTQDNQPPSVLSKGLGSKPLPDDDGAFYPHDDFFLHENHEGTWKRWHLHAPRNAYTPGDGKILPTGESFGFAKLREMLVSVAELRRKEPNTFPLSTNEAAGDADEQRFEKSQKERYARNESSDFDLGPEHHLEGALDALVDPTLTDRLVANNEAFLDDTKKFWLRLKFLTWSLQSARALLRAACKNSSKESLRRIYYTVDTTAAIATGIFRDVVDKNLSSFDHLDDQELRAWLASHGAAESGANPDMLLQNPTVRFVYNSAFSFVGGDHEQPNIAAGAALRGILRLFLTYKGALAYRMSSGMGDAVFSPIYEVLRRRKVRFEFFNRVDQLRIENGPEGPQIAAIEIGQQVKLRAPADGYHPFVWVQGIPAWPDRPLYDQIEEGERLELAVKDGLHLEDPTARHGIETVRTLKVGQDFHQVVLGIPVAALAAITGDLQKHPQVGERWNAMIHGVQTTPTQAFQVWFRGSLRDLGWTAPAPVTGTYVDPIDTYIDMTPALRLEERRPGDVKSLAYFCGVLKEIKGERPRAGAERAVDNAITHLTTLGHHLFPNLKTGDAFDWSLLSGFEAKSTGRARFSSQYARANILPSERYTLGLHGTTKLRLATDGSGVRNLFLAGDWVRNPINLGCVEATVMSGLQAARALSKTDVLITGEKDDYLWASLGRGEGPVNVLESMDAAPEGAPLLPPTRTDGEETPPPPPTWDATTSLADLKAAVEGYDEERTRALCEAFVAFLETDATVSPEVAIETLELLKSKRFFELMGTVAQALEQNGHNAPKIHRLHAQALIERGAFPNARQYLDMVLNDPLAGTEIDEALGLIGRSHKQYFIDKASLKNSSAQKLARNLNDSVDAYLRGYDRNPDENTWHGMNLVALLERARRDNIVIPKAEGLATSDLTAKIVAAIQKRPLSTVKNFHLATLVEAHVARGELDEALKAARRYVVDASAFAMGSLLRQLETVWQLEAQGPKAERLLTYLRAYLLEAEGGRLQLDGAHLKQALDNSRGLQRIHGDEGPIAVSWYMQGLERCRLVARISRADGAGGGTGFLVRATDFRVAADPDQLLLLTNAHVLGDDAGAVRANEARVSFTVPPDNLPAKEFRVKQILSTSGESAGLSQTLDYALAELDPPVRGLTAYPIAMNLPRKPDAKAAAADRLYVVGHPSGGELAISLYDNRLIDYGDRLLHYRCPTLPGSSGSAVLNRSWELVGLHHAGGRMQRLGASGNYEVNEGIRIDRIREHSRRSQG